MARVSGVLPNLINGVSQQSPQIRLPSQGDFQENCYSTVVTGLTKRPPTHFVAKIADSIEDGAFIHIINRDENEKYIVIIDSTGISVYDFDGNKKIVNYQSNGYLDADNPLNDYAAVTVADYTFITNKTKTVQKGAKKSPKKNPHALVTINALNYGRTYKIRINGTLYVTYKTDEGSESGDARQLRTNEVAQAIVNVLRNGSSSDPDVHDDIESSSRLTGQKLPSGFFVARNGPTIYIENTDGQDFTISVDDNGENSGQSFKCVKDAVNKFEDLPYHNYPGAYFKIQPELADQHAWYVVGEANNVWRETVCHDIEVEIDKNTMPHALVREADGSFTFKPVDWDERKAGDDVSNPFPSFVGSKIVDVFFHKNRLGFLADENVILSASGEFFKFWLTTATALLDDDPIDVASTHTKVSLLKAAIPYQEALLLFSDQTQFKLQGGNLLTPTSASLPVTTEFQCSTRARPVGVGPYVYFVVEKEHYSALMEYFVDSETNTNDARDVTSHVPRYVPAGIIKLAATTNENAIVALSEREQNVMYVYKFFWGEDGSKLQSSWSKYTFPGVTKILDFAFIRSDLYIVLTREDGLYLERMSFEQGARGNPTLGFVAHLDQQIEHDHPGVSVSYDAGSNLTTFTFPFVWKNVPVIVATGEGAEDRGHSVPIVGDPDTYDSNEIVVEGDYSTEPLIFGVPYESRYDLSELLVRQETRGGGTVVVSEGRLQVQRITFQYDQTGYFRVHVQPEGRPEYIYEFNGRQIGDADNIIGAPAIDSGEFTVPVMSRSDRVSISIRSSSFLPFALISAEWYGQWSPKSRRVG